MTQQVAGERAPHFDAAQRLNANPVCIPSNYSRLIARELELQTRKLPRLLQSTQLTIEQFMQEDTLLTARQQLQIIENALHLTRHASFGLRLGKRLTPSTHGAMGFLAHSSPNFLMAVKAFQTYLPTRMYFARLEIHSDENWLECELDFDIDLSPAIRRMLTETIAVILFEAAEFIIGQPLTEAITRFSHDEPDYSAEYKNYLAGQFEFSAAEIRVKIPMHMCHIPNASANHENYLMAQQQCENMLAQLLANNHSSKYRIQKMMLSHPPGALTEEEAAAALFVSKRTLARRLQKEGTGFRQIRDEILSQQASDYLRESQMSVDAVAALLNYHDSANFRRAFKRWFSMSPDQYRQQAGG